MSSAIEGRVDRENWYCGVEADETVFWLEMLSDCSIVPAKKLEALLAEAHELSALFTAPQRTGKVHGSGS